MAKNSKQTKPHKQFDENEFVQDFVEGKFALADLAKKHGRTLRQVNDILSGRSRSYLLARIERAIAFGRQRTVRQLASLQDDAVSALARAVKGQADTVSLTAAKEILNRSLDIESSGEPKGRRGSAARPASLAKARLPRSAKRRMLAELDGPQPG